MSWAGIETVCRYAAFSVREKAQFAFTYGEATRGMRLIRAARRLDSYANFAQHMAGEPCTCHPFKSLAG